jgi:hypothetical protein
MRGALGDPGGRRLPELGALSRPDDAPLRARLKSLAAERRFGYRRLHVLLWREGNEVNRKRFQRLYREEADRASPRRPQAGAGRATPRRDAERSWWR